MAMYSNILVAVDLSKEAVEVLKVAADMAAGNQATVSILHVCDDFITAYGYYGHTMIVDEHEIREEARKRISRDAASVGLNESDIHIETGHPIDSIIERARNDGTDLIVIGSHGRHGVKLLLGSTANGVLHRAPCDVLAVRVTE